MPLTCLSCGRAYPDVAALERHRWWDHAGDLDHGTGTADRTRLDGLVDDPPEPPRLA